MSESNTKASAPTRCATSAESRSLSPNRISLVATVSFSFTIATACSTRSRSRVRWALVCWARIEMSCALSSTCPTVRPYRAKAALQEFTSATCPTLAAACLVARSFGRRVNPSGSMPAAMAPEETITTSVPAFIRASIASASPASRLVSKTPDRCGQRVGPDLDDQTARGSDGFAMFAHVSSSLVDSSRCSRR